MAKYEKREYVEALQYEGNDFEKVMEFASVREITLMLDGSVVLHTLENRLKLNRGDWLIQGDDGNLYVVDDRTFQEHYTPA